MAFTDHGATELDAGAPPSRQSSSDSGTRSSYQVRVVSEQAMYCSPWNGVDG